MAPRKGEHFASLTRGETAVPRTCEVSLLPERKLGEVSQGRNCAFVGAWLGDGLGLWLITHL